MAAYTFFRIILGYTFFRMGRAYAENGILSNYAKNRICALETGELMDQASRTMQQLGANLRRFRKQRGLTQGELGAQINKRQATISTLEAGHGGALDTLLAVLSALDLELVIRRRSKSTTAELGDLF